MREARGRKGSQGVARGRELVVKGAEKERCECGTQFWCEQKRPSKPRTPGDLSGPPGVRPARRTHSDPTGGRLQVGKVGSSFVNPLVAS